MDTACRSRLGWTAVTWFAITFLFYPQIVPGCYVLQDQRRPTALPGQAELSNGER